MYDIGERTLSIAEPPPPPPCRLRKKHSTLTNAELKEVVRWIHGDLAELELALLINDAMKRGLGEPLVKRQGEDVVAASYFKLLSGGVATLGGVRAVPGQEAEAVRLLCTQVEWLKVAALPQIQAVVPEADVVSANLLEQTGFEKLTNVEHQWLHLSRGMLSVDWASHRDGIPKLGWITANQVTRKRLEQLVAATFVQTLDCPALNDVRTSQEVLEGFLEGRRLRHTDGMWEVLLEGDRLIGCVLLSQHPNHLMELVYLGLVPQSRGRGLGRMLVGRAIDRAHRQACMALAVSVDEANWPALAVYRKFGFQTYRRLGVWLMR